MCNIYRKYVDTHLVALVEAEHCALSSLERELAHVHVGPRGGAAAGLLVILSMGDHCEAGETLLSCVIHHSGVPSSSVHPHPAAALTPGPGSPAAS